MTTRIFIICVLLCSITLGNTIKINFQPADSEIPPDYLVDSGQAFGDRNNGYTYGWQSEMIWGFYDRHDEDVDQRKDTLASLQYSGNPPAVWEIELENDLYDVVLVCGDPTNKAPINDINLEGTLLEDYDQTYFDEFEATIEVTDGRMTLKPTQWAINAHVCYIDITPLGTVNHAPVVNAGNNEEILWPKNYINLTGQVQDDGKGDPEGFLEYRWSLVRGPAQVVFDPDANTLNSRVIFPGPGNYTLKLRASDGLLSREKEILISVLPPDCPVGDLTHECIVDLADYALFVEQWLGEIGVDADFQGEDGVNLPDYAMLSENWLADWTGSVQVNILPPEAATDGAQWRIDEGVWQNSGQKLDLIREGDHTIEFKSVVTWSEPQNRTIYLSRHQSLTLTSTYVGLPDSPLIINEFLAINSNLSNFRPAPADLNYTNVEGHFDYADWIELRNTRQESISLDGWYLTDNPDNLTKWQFPTGYQIAGGGHFIVWASNKDQDRYPDNYPYIDVYGALHTNFDLDGDGGYLALVEPDGVTIAHEYVDYPSQRGLISYGIGANDRIGYLKSRTFGNDNADAWQGVVADTHFSVDRGFYNDPISVELSCDTPGAIIRYTTDSSEPGPAHGTTYVSGNPINITKTTCLRVMAYKENYLSTNIDTQTYLYLANVKNQGTNTSGGTVVPDGYPSQWISDGGPAITGDYQVDPDIANPSGTFGSLYANNFVDDLKAIPTVSLVTDIDFLFGATGIYTNQSQDGTERTCSLELMDPAGQEEGFHVNCGVRMQGGAGISGGTSLDRWKIPKLSMRVVFRGGYGPSKLRYDLFEDPGATNWFDTFVLDARSNNVWYHSDTGQQTRAQYTRDQFIADMQNDMGGWAPNGRPVHFYLNGLYWGLYWLHERPDESFAAAYLGGEPDDYDILKHDNSIVVNGSATDYNQMLNIPSTDYTSFQQAMDVPNFIDYLILNFYLGNWDWSHKNWYASRNPKDPDGRWRFHCWDGEHIMEGVGENQTANDEADKPVGIHYKWMENPEYATLFGDRIYRHLYNDGELTPAKVIQHYIQIANEIDRAIVGESARWGDFRRATPYTRNNEWWTQRQWLVNSYLPVRRDDMIGQFRALGWYPAFDPPDFYVNGTLQHGGAAATGAILTMDNHQGNTIIYTTDGITDPGDYAGSNVIRINLVPEDAMKYVLVPTQDIGDSWQLPAYTPDSEWRFESGIVGFESYPADYANLIDINVRSEMYRENASCFIRIPFTLTGNEAIESLELKVRYDDGFIAYLDGAPFYAVNANNEDWDAYATASHSDSLAVLQETFTITDPSIISGLTSGSHILAIHGMNRAATNNDFLMGIELIGTKTETTTTNNIKVYSSLNPPVLNKSVHIKARSLTNGNWSALHEATFAVGPVVDYLRITEIMYHPDEAPAGDPNAEFIELRNISTTQTINPALAKFTNGIDFEFPDMALAPGEYIVLVRNLDAFNTQYPTFSGQIAGVYQGSLDNAGERIVLVDALGAVIHDFKYQDGWFDLTDGEGFSLTIWDDTADPVEWDVKTAWLPSSVLKGTPGQPDLDRLPPNAILINEVLAHSDQLYPYDWIELKNTTGSDINIGGWYLSDDGSNKYKYLIPPATIIPRHGFKVFYQDSSFGQNPPSDPANIPFGLTENGETVYLTATTVGYEDSENFGATRPDTSMGRYLKSNGKYSLVEMAYPTPGEENSAPRVGPIVINEIMYNPNSANSGGEFVELYNNSNDPVTLKCWDNPLGQFLPWRFTDENAKLDLIFPDNTTIPAGGYLILVENKAEFLAYYASFPGNPDSVLQWSDGGLSDGGEPIELGSPADEDPDTHTRYYVREDKVDYDDDSPWPTAADGKNGDGSSLQRIDPAAYGNDVINWKAAQPTPGGPTP